MIDCKKVFENYSEKVYAYLRYHLSNQEDIEDLHSHIFSKIVQSADSYRGNPDAVSSFVYTITKNSVLNYKRKKNIFISMDFLTVFFPMKSITGNEENTEENYFKNETLENLSKALKLLMPNERALIIYCYYEEMTLKQAAIKCGISYSACKRLHQKALERLRGMME